MSEKAKRYLYRPYTGSGEVIDAESRERLLHACEFVLATDMDAAEKRIESDRIKIGVLRIDATEQAKTIERYEEFIRNGVEFGHIVVPDQPDPARDTIDAILNGRTPHE